MGRGACWTTVHWFAKSQDMTEVTWKACHCIKNDTTKSPPERAPRLQLAVEQPSTGGH